MADSHEDDPFSSIPATFWWCVVTLTTVGYGDAYPLTAYGKLAAAFTMIASVVITALPISVIGAFIFICVRAISVTSCFVHRSQFYPA